MEALHVVHFETILGNIVAIADEQGLYLLAFTDWKGIEKKIEQYSKQGKKAITSASNALTQLMQEELRAYLQGEIQHFTVPIHIGGTPFQKSVWQLLPQITYGTTISYLKQAAMLGKPTAYRAIANANGNNQLSIIIPCHRVINNNGTLGGYGGGLWRKEWLLNHEKKYKKN